MHTSATPFYRTTSACLGLVWSLMLAACSPEATTNLDPPAPPGSAQPNLATTAHGALVLSFLVHQHLQTTTHDGNAWSPPTSITHGEDILVNWADFPSVLPLRSELWAAHWLRRRPGGDFAYDAEIAWSNDAGQTWSSPRTLHDDQTPTEHGFVSLYPAGHTVGALWLDGRAYAGGTGATQLMHRTSRSDGTFSNEQVLVGRFINSES